MATNQAIIIPAPSTNSAVTSTNAVLQEGLRDIRDAVPIPPSLLWLWITLAVIGLLILAWLAWRKWYRPKPKSPVLPDLVPAYRTALDDLQAALTLLHDPEPFCTRVSQILRVYLEEQFDFHAPERTTEEFLQELQTSFVLSGGQKTSLEDFLNRCDLVKFARYEPAETELRDLHDAALRLVEETAPIGSAVGASRSAIVEK